MPSAQSLVPETRQEIRAFAMLVEDPARQAKADSPRVLRARMKAWLQYWQSLAWWQAPSRRRPFDPVGEIPQPIVSGPRRFAFSHQESRHDS